MEEIGDDSVSYPTIQDLQKRLQDRIEALDKQRQEEATRFEKEMAERNTLVESERRQRAEEHQRKEEEHRQRKQKELEVVELQKRESARQQKEAELASNAAQEAKRQQEEKLRWLKDEIAKQEFVEEQHRKRMETARIADTTKEPEDSVEINVEHPIAPYNRGEAVLGTEGTTPGHNLMSSHLKQILRQATRTY